MRHRMIAPSIHSEVLTTAIDFDATPFVVRRELGEWRRPVIEGVEVPRRAGVSGFGAGGSNAHLIVEEYIPPERAAVLRPTPAAPAVFVLSAKNAERLAAKANALSACVERDGLTDDDLADIAYTLQVGREAMEERAAFTAASIGELRQKLAVLGAGEETSDVMRGQARESKETLGALVSDEDMGQTIAAWVAKRKYAELLDLWTKGLAFDWDRLYGDEKPRRIGLPAYPFARDRYWVPELEGELSRTPSLEQRQLLHPLLHVNTSDLSEQRFSSVFTGSEPFLSDHVVSGVPILPGVAHLEMAREALCRALCVSGEERVSLSDVVFVQPIAVSQQVEVHTAVAPETNGSVSFRIYSDGQLEGPDLVPFSQGLGAVEMSWSRPRSTRRHSAAG